jgi:hypothetical protein
MRNPAFEFLRQFKQVSEVTEELVTKNLKKKFPNLTIEQLTDIFEKGISGDYGKVYAMDVQTILGWVEDFMRNQGSQKHYLDSGLLDPSIHITDVRYPTGIREWNQEVNKCYNSYLKGVKPEYFHPHVYDRLVMDNKIHHSDFIKYMSSDAQTMYKDGQYESVGIDIRRGKHKSIEVYFNYHREQGHDKIYQL